MPRRVLIVDDDPSLRRGLAMLVQTGGHETVSAATVQEGMDQLGSGPSHLILDMNLPDGPGTTILRHIREQGLPIRVAILSGTADQSLVAEADALRPDAVFRKPPDWDALLGWVAA